jgi:4-amino-4-deoxy-L-arabinose transferase-like glycosyltransferase
VLILALARTRWLSRWTRILRGAGLACGVLALFACPAGWSLTPALAPGGRMVPIADPILLQHRVPPELEAENHRLVINLVETLRAADGSTRYLLAAPDIHLAAPFIIETGAPVMAYGGFSGMDPILTPDAFAKLVRMREVRFALVVDGWSPGRMGPVVDEGVSAWIRRNGREIARDDRPENRLSAEHPPRPAPWGETAELVQSILTNPSIRLFDLQPGDSP